MTKIDLFNRLKDEGLFWNNDNGQQNYVGDDALIEHTLLFGDVGEIKSLFNIFDNNAVQDVWEQKLLPVKKFKSLNYYLSVCFFNKKNSNIIL